MSRGRPPLGLGHVDGLEGTPEEKERLKTVLGTIAGDLTVKEACGRLGVGETRFHEIRRVALEGMLGALAPRPPGRPPKEGKPKEVEELEAQVAWLEEELEISRLRTEIAAWKPELLRDPVPPRKKKVSSAERRRRRRTRNDSPGTS